MMKMTLVGFCTNLIAIFKANVFDNALRILHVLCLHMQPSRHPIWLDS